MNRTLCTATLVIGLLALTACSSEEDPAPAAPILTITNSWGDENESDHDFLFVSSDDGESSGAFTGEEITPDSDTFDLTGTWSGGRVTFTVERATAVTYTARFNADNPERLVFESDEGQLVLLLGG